MQTRLPLAIVAMMSLMVGGQASASPITFAFTGNLPARINGATQFSGALTINADPTGPGGYFGGTGWPVYETGNDVSLALKLGGQTFNIVNQSNPSTSVLFAAGLSPSWVTYQTGPQQDEATMLASFQGTNPLATFEFGLSFYSPTASDQLTNLRKLSFPLASGSVFVDGTIGSSNFQEGGTFTSFDLVPTPTPEPNTFVIFGVLGLAAMTRLRRS